MAIYFWLAFGSAIIVVAAALGPALAVRRAGQSPAAEQNARAVAK
jgi:heme exporter protein D